jgi:hypothetical protein
LAWHHGLGRSNRRYGRLPDLLFYSCRRFAAIARALHTKPQGCTGGGRCWGCDMKVGWQPLLTVPMPAVAPRPIRAAAMGVLVAEVAMMAIARGHAPPTRTTTSPCPDHVPMSRGARVAEVAGIHHRPTRLPANPVRETLRGRLEAWLLDFAATSLALADGGDCVFEPALERCGGTGDERSEIARIWVGLRHPAARIRKTKECRLPAHRVCAQRSRRAPDGGADQ